MKITAIEITNVKGIGKKSFTVDILPNKPNLLVAPNGFGKSSIATAFSSMNSKRMTLDAKDCHQEDESKVPELAVTVSSGRLVADNTKNEIRQSFDVTVFRSGLRPKATQRKMGGFTSSTASLEVESIPLRRIPDKAFFDYKASDFKSRFGANGKVLPNIGAITTSPLLCQALAGVSLGSVTGKRIQDNIVGFVDSVNQQSGSVEQIIDWIAQNSLNELRGIPVLSELAANFSKLGLAASEPEAFLAGYQLIEIYKSDSRSTEEVTRYLTGKNYDPLAVCFALRVKVEETAHAAIGDAAQKVEFLEVVHTTKNKIEYVAERGIEVPEMHFLLGLIYNTNLHWKAGRDYISPLVAKLNHPTIHQMISQVFH